MSKDRVKLFQRARAALQSEKAALSKTLAKAQATVADSEKKLAEIQFVRVEAKRNTKNVTVPEKLIVDFYWWGCQKL